MQTFKFIKRCLSLSLCLVLCLSMLPGNAQAIDPIDLEAKTSLSLTFRPGDRAAEGTEFRVWRVGEPDEFCNFTKTEAFAGYDVVVTNLNADGWADLANTLSGYVTRDKLEPNATAVVNKDGVAVFSGLDTGLYLVCGDVYKYGRYTYTPTAVMISLPNRDAQDQWIYDVEANVKYTEKYTPGGGGGSSKTSIKVVKIWEDEGEEVRPTEVVIQLLKDGAVYDTVTLNKDNSWRHTWTNMSKSANWQVVEKTVPEGYAVLVSNDSLYTFTVTNTSEPDIPPDPPPLDPPPPEDPPENPPEDPPETPPQDPPGNNPPGNNPPGNNPPGNTPPPNLPQTGMLWWPVPLLAVSGMGCFLAGWVKDRKEDET